MKRPVTNISTPERVGRVVVGAVGVVAGLLMLLAASGAATVVLLLLLIAAGVDLIVTGTVGHCPLYSKLGHVPRSLRTRS